MVNVMLLIAVSALLSTQPAVQSVAQPAETRTVSPRGDLAADERATIDLFENARESVVAISTSESVRDFMSRNVMQVPRGSGSGFVWDGNGHVITNWHVLEGASGAQVQLADGREFDARLVGASPAHDLAVLRIGGAQFASPARIPVGTSSDLRVGQGVFAIGNPFGLDWTLTTGIVSALDRSLPSESGPDIRQLIQTDAAINPGNSGGPLLDSAGRLIGVNTAIFSPSGANAGIGFAVPVDTVMRVVPQLIANGRYTRPSIGVDSDESFNTRLKRASGIEGVFVLRVERGGPADRAGLQPARRTMRGIAAGDIITELDCEPVDRVGDLLARLDDYDVGERVDITFLRDDQPRTIEVELVAGD